MIHLFLYLFFLLFTTLTYSMESVSDSIISTNSPITTTPEQKIIEQLAELIQNVCGLNKNWGDLPPAFSPLVKLVFCSL